MSKIIFLNTVIHKYGKDEYGSTVYITPTGKRYHYRATCAGKNAMATTIKRAKSAGYTVCKKCG